MPQKIDTFINKEKSNFLDNFIHDGAQIGAIGSELYNIFNSKDLIVEIPGQLKDLLKSGEACFDASKIVEGNFSPNIRKRGQNGIAGQITLKEGIDGKTIANSLTNLAMIAMLQSILSKLDCIEENIEDIKNGQLNDRIGLVIGSFKSFCDLYSTFKSQNELREVANNVYQDMQIGLGQIHLQIENERQNLQKAPANNMQALIFAVKNVFKSGAIDRYRRQYLDYIYHLNIYHRLIILSDMILIAKGDSNVMNRNHEVITRYISDYLDEKFNHRMKYLLNREPQELNFLTNLKDNISSSLLEMPDSNLKIEFSK